jgi:ABC-type antimicrobial peptide transport system permease subunit
MIEASVPSVDVYTPEQVAARDVNMGRTFFAPIMGLLVTVAYVMGLLVVALIMYSDVRGRLKSFAVLKAIGFPFKSLVIAVLLQAALLLAVAFPVAVAAALGLTSIIHIAAPVYLIRFFEPSVFVQTLAASLFFAITGAFIPLRLIRRSDPTIAFEGG